MHPNKFQSDNFFTCDNQRRKPSKKRQVEYFVAYVTKNIQEKRTAHSIII